MKVVAGNVDHRCRAVNRTCGGARKRANPAEEDRRQPTAPFGPGRGVLDIAARRVRTPARGSTSRRNADGPLVLRARILRVPAPTVEGEHSTELRKVSRLLGYADSGAAGRQPSPQERSMRPLEIDVDVVSSDEQAAGSILVADSKTPNDESPNVNRSRRGLRGSSRACREIECSSVSRTIVTLGLSISSDSTAISPRRIVDGRSPRTASAEKKGTLEPSAASVRCRR